MTSERLRFCLLSGRAGKCQFREFLAFHFCTPLLYFWINQLETAPINVLKIEGFEVEWEVWRIWHFVIESGADNYLWLLQSFPQCDYSVEKHDAIQSVVLA